MEENNIVDDSHYLPGALFSIAWTDAVLVARHKLRGITRYTQLMQTVKQGFYCVLLQPTASDCLATRSRCRPWQLWAPCHLLTGDYTTIDSSVVECCMYVITVETQREGGREGGREVREVREVREGGREVREVREGDGIIEKVGRGIGRRVSPTATVPVSLKLLLALSQFLPCLLEQQLQTLLEPETQVRGDTEDTASHNTVKHSHTFLLTHALTQTRVRGDTEDTASHNTVKHSHTFLLTHALTQTRVRGDTEDTASHNTVKHSHTFLLTHALTQTRVRGDTEDTASHNTVKHTASHIPTYTRTYTDTGQRGYRGHGLTQHS